MELHVLGPAFSLPSIDAECIGAIAFLRLSQIENSAIVPSHDQTKQLPYLIDGEKCIEGLKNITRHLQPASSNLDAKQQADSIALTSFIQSYAQTLLDISLYVSFENYSTTRSAFTKILPWHANYVIPPARRAAARKRTEHLGISSIDVDDVHEDVSGFADVGKEKQFEAETKKRADTLLMKRNTVKGLLQSRPEHSAVFKLHALADSFFGALEDMLGDREFLLGTQEAQVVDCIAYGYLSLMLYPQLPQDWLAKTMRKKYSKLVQYTEGLHAILQLDTDAEKVMSLSQCKNQAEIKSFQKANSINLPWTSPAQSSMTDITKSIASDLISRIPIIGTPTTLISTSNHHSPNTWQRYWPTILLSTATSIGLLGYYALTTGMLIWPHGEEVHIFGRKRLTDYGHLGAALAGVSLLGQQAGRQQGQPDRPASVGMQVDVEVEKDTEPP